MKGGRTAFRAGLAGQDGPSHGADVYDAHGRVLGLKDFSSTVPCLPPPAGWKRRAQAAVAALRRYPRPHARGLDAVWARSLGLPLGAVLVTNGASEALDCCARAVRGKRVRLLAPCFGEYRALLLGAGARVGEFWWDGSRALDPAALLSGLPRGSQVWLANPGNPLGQVLTDREVLALAALCARRGVDLLVDEALRSQRLDPNLGRDGLLAASQGLPVLWVRSLGKGLGLPGLRLGLLAGPPRRIRALRPFLGPWSVNGLAQELGAWAFRAESQGAAKRQRLLAVWGTDLRTGVEQLGLRVLSKGATGYACVDLGVPARPVAAALARRGFLVRDASSFGTRAASWLRLNPRAPRENRVLLLALGRVLGRGAGGRA